MTFLLSIQVYTSANQVKVQYSLASIDIISSLLVSTGSLLIWKEHCNNCTVLNYKNPYCIGDAS